MSDKRRDEVVADRSSRPATVDDEKGGGECAKLLSDRVSLSSASAVLAAAVQSNIEMDILSCWRNQKAPYVNSQDKTSTHSRVGSSVFLLAAWCLPQPPSLGLDGYSGVVSSWSAVGGRDCGHWRLWCAGV